MAVGGDGTVNEVVNGLMGEGAVARAELAVLPTGRGRDSARTLGIPSRALPAALGLDLGRVRAVDLGVAEWAGGRRYFVNTAGAGFDAVVAEHAARAGGGGTVPYLRAVLAALRDYQPVEVVLERDGHADPPQVAAGVVIANGPCFGGGMRIAPGASPTDGVLDLVVLGALGRGELLRWLPTIYWGGHLRNPKVSRVWVRRVAVDATPAVPIELDGERCGQSPFLVRVCPGALRVRG